MWPLLWLVLYCTQAWSMEFCGIVPVGSSCDLKTHCNVCPSNPNCKIINSITDLNETDSSLKSIAQYNGFIFYTDKHGKVQRFQKKTNNIPITHVYPVMWGDRLLFINSTKVYELRKDKIVNNPSLLCTKDKRTGSYYFKETELSAIPQEGLMAGGTLIKINSSYKRVNPIMEPMNKICSIQETNNNYLCCISPATSVKRANLTFIYNYVKYFIPFKYLENPVITSQDQNSSYYWGERQLEFHAKYLSHINQTEIYYGENDPTVSENCILEENTILCFSPRINPRPNNLSETSEEFTLVLKMDTYKTNINLTYYPNPNFNMKSSMEDDIITIKGEYLNQAAEEAEYEIMVGNENCTIEILEENFIKCRVQNKDIDGNITVKLHSKIETLKLEKIQHQIPNKPLYLWVILGGILLFLLLLLLVIIGYRVYYRAIRQKKKRGQYVLTDEYSGQLMSVIVRQGIPFQKPSDYVKRILWTHKPPGSIRYDTQNMSDSLKESLEQLGLLLKNKYFLLPMLKALEKERSLTDDYKFNYSYHLSIHFSSDLRYFLELCEELLVHLVSLNKGSKSKKLFLSCSSITEYMILNWLGISMYSYMKENIGDMLYFFTHDLKSYLEKMPIDEVTGYACQYFFDKYQLKKNIKYNEIQIQAEMQGAVESVTVFTCDSVVQLKKKCLEAFYRGRPVSEIPDVDDIRIESNRVIIEEFKREENARGFTSHLTLDNWNIQEDILLKLTFVKAPQVAEANTNDRYTTLGSSVARITTKSNRKFMHLQEPPDPKTEQPLTKKDLKKMVFPVSLEYKLMQLIYKLLDSKNKSAPLSCLYNLFQKSAQKTGVDKTWLLNCYIKQFCCQFIAEPNILLDINQELYMKKNLEGMKNYSVYILERCMKEPLETSELHRNITNFFMEFSEENADIQELMSTLQNISNDITRDVSFSKENSLYYLFKMMQTNDAIIHSALMKEEKACRLRLADQFLSIIEQIEIGQTKRDTSFSS